MGGAILVILADARRDLSPSCFLKHLCFLSPVAYVFWFRVFSFVYNEIPIAKPIIGFFHWMNSLLLGIQIPLGTVIGKGLIIKHYSNIVVNRNAIIGEKCTMFHGVTIGMEFCGKRKGFPIIGDNVILFPGSKIIGSVKIGNNVVIGSNAVIVTDVPDNSIVAGVPGKVISNNVNPYMHAFRLM